MTAFVARCDAKVGFASFTGAVDDTPHNCNLEWQFFVCEGSLRAIGNFNHVNFCSAATRTGDQINIFSLAQTERLEQLSPRTRFFDWVGSKAVANRVTDAFKQQRRDARSRFD